MHEVVTQKDTGASIISVGNRRIRYTRSFAGTVGLLGVISVLAIGCANYMIRVDNRTTDGIEPLTIEDVERIHVEQNRTAERLTKEVMK